MCVYLFTYIHVHIIEIGRMYGWIDRRSFFDEHFRHSQDASACRVVWLDHQDLQKIDGSALSGTGGNEQFMAVIHFDVKFLGLVVGNFLSFIKGLINSEICSWNNHCI